MADTEMTFDATKAAFDAGYAAGWAAYGDLMIEQLGPDGMVWRPIEAVPPPHGCVVLLGWNESGEWMCSASAYSTGKRYSNGYSTVSYHGSATHWMPLPKPPMTSARKETA